MIETRIADRLIPGIAPAEGGALRWVLCIEGSREEIETLAKEFSIHPLAVEDMESRNQRPKVDEYPGQLFVVMFAAVPRGDAGVNLTEVHILVGADYVLTVLDAEVPAISALATLCSRREDILSGGPGRLFHHLADAIVDSYFPLLDELDAALDDVETAIIQRPDQATFQDIFTIKRQLNLLRRVLGPQRDLLQGLAGPHGPMLGEESQLYLRDVYDHAVRFVEQVDSYRDLVTSGLDVYLSSVSNRLGEQTRRLSVVATIFLPLTFLTGFFGQNFGFLVNNIQDQRAFMIGIGIELGSVAIIWYVVRRTTIGARAVPSEPTRRRPVLTIGRPRKRPPLPTDILGGEKRKKKKKKKPAA